MQPAPSIVAPGSAEAGRLPGGQHPQSQAPQPPQRQLIDVGAGAGCVGGGGSPQAGGLSSVATCMGCQGGPAPMVAPLIPIAAAAAVEVLVQLTMILGVILIVAYLLDTLGITEGAREGLNSIVNRVAQTSEGLWNEATEPPGGSSSEGVRPNSRSESPAADSSWSHQGDPGNDWEGKPKKQSGQLKKLNDRQLKKYLKQTGEDPHSFKKDYVGDDGGRFDVAIGPGREFYLVSKNGKIKIPTGRVAP